MGNLQITIEARAIKAAKYIVEMRCTLRQAEEALGIPKSTIHLDMKRLEFIDPFLHSKVREILDNNWDERQMRGGMATKKKYQMMKKVIFDTSGSMMPQ